MRRVILLSLFFFASLSLMGQNYFKYPIHIGVAGTNAGSIVLYNGTSGSITIQPTTGALGTRTFTLPAANGTFSLEGHTQAQSTITNLSDTLLVRYTKTQANNKFATLTEVRDTVQIVGLDMIYLDLTPTANPPTAVEGRVYYDTDHHIYVYNGTTWVQLDN